MDKRTTIVDESWYENDGSLPVRETAGGVVIRLKDGIKEVALITEGDLPRYVLPKGGIDPGESPLEAARRETLEEAGFSQLFNLGKLAITRRQNFVKTRWVETLYFLFVTEQNKGFPTDETRSYEQFWFPLDEVKDMFWPEQEKLLHDLNDEIHARVDRYNKLK